MGTGCEWPKINGFDLGLYLQYIYIIYIYKLYKPYISGVTWGSLRITGDFGAHFVSCSMFAEF